MSGVRCYSLHVSDCWERERQRGVAINPLDIAKTFIWPLSLCYRRFRGPSTYHHTTLATSMPSARRVKLVGALIACSLLLVALTVARPECYNADNKRCTAVEEINSIFGFVSLMLLLVVGATWPLIVLIAVLTVLCCHCRHRKKRINYNAIAMITAEDRKERAKQYMAHGAV